MNLSIRFWQEWLEKAVGGVGWAINTDGMLPILLAKGGLDPIRFGNKATLKLLETGNETLIQSSDLYPCGRGMQEDLHHLPDWARRVRSNRSELRPAW